MNNNSRWWEFYLVRYFVGTVFGTLLVLLIVYSPDSGINRLLDSNKFRMSGFNINKFDLSYLWLYGFIGLAYCYLASAPVLVLHTVRAVFPRLILLVNSKMKIFVFAIIFSLIVCLLVWKWKEMQDYLGGSYTFAAYILATIIIGFQIFLFMFLIKKNDMFKFYKNLSTKRSEKEKLVTTEYVESYKHLREHGNAFLILLFEIILCFIIYNSNSLFVFSSFLTLWILPASLVWFSGTYLESKINKL